MSIVCAISIKNILSSSELLDFEDAKRFFTDEISQIIVDYIVIDFSGVKVMNSSFAIQYLICKQNMKGKKVIKEIHLAKNICKAIQLAEKEIHKSGQKTKDKKKDPMMVRTALVLDNS